MLKIFAFSFDTEKNQAAATGNMSMLEALQVLQQLVIQDAVQKSTQGNGKKEDTEPIDSVV